MKVSIAIAAAVASLPALVSAQVAAWGQCFPIADRRVLSDPKSTAGPPSADCSGVTKFKHFGVNQAGAEFGGGTVPGQLGTHYTWPKTTSIDYFLGIGMNTFRIPFLMERMVPPAQGLAGTMDAAYLAGLKEIATYITGKGGYAVIDPHNYGRYNGGIITDTAAFGTWCKNIAGEFKYDPNIVFDTNNEYHDMDQTLVFELNQACIDGIRAAGATSQLILVEGNSWTGAWSWVSSGNAPSMVELQDPNDNIAYEMHQYLDGDGSGTSETCVSSTIGEERLAAATDWLKQNGKKGFIGEIGAGSNDACITAVHGALCHMQQAGGVWIGALWWAAGPWWGTYFQSIEPPDGPSISRILPEALMPFI
ncbi:Glycoside Hydrolase Family 5 protein [Tuber magnatum]|uniref:cellulase n=1 Tax=Tuber magnatum TaxID=42249 RepID=A0A317T0A9_9PEZI|nr:Glycoside Hydrolase Family 5 protein [Tuber magnatum]